MAIIDQIEYCEKQVAQFEAAEVMLKESCLVEQTLGKSDMELQLRNIVSNTGSRQSYAKKKVEEKNQSFISDHKSKMNRLHDRLMQLDRNFKASQH